MLYRFSKKYASNLKIGLNELVPIASSNLQIVWKAREDGAERGGNGSGYKFDEFILKLRRCYVSGLESVQASILW